MTRINQEEYEVLKRLIDRTRKPKKYIARDEDGMLYAYRLEPRRHTNERWVDGYLKVGVSNNLFQFIQWEDENPYNIADLIEEYENKGFLNKNLGIWAGLDNLQHADNDTSKLVSEESEETEVKKGLNWFKEQLVDIEMNTPRLGSHDSIWMLDRVNELLNQLDEPEVLSKEWIDEHAEHHEYIGYAGVPVDDLQNLLVPKQEEVDRAYRKGFKEGKRQTAEYFESITEEPNYGQVQKYLSERGFKVVDKEPETVASVLDDFYKSIERMKKVLSMEVKELEE